MVDDEFAEFVAATSVGLLKTARLLTGDWHLGEDLLQAALVNVYLSWDRRSTWLSPTAYTRQCLVNLYCTWRRRRWHAEVAHADPAQGLSVSDSTGHVDSADLLERALMTLGRRQRAVVVLRYYDDLSVTEVAEILGCGTGTVTSLASRALAQLRGVAALRPAIE